MADEYENELRRAGAGDARERERKDLREDALREGAVRGPAPGGAGDVDRDKGGAARGGGPPPDGSLDDFLERDPGPVEGAHMVEGALEENRELREEQDGDGTG